jgi:hypothetical protein
MKLPTFHVLDTDVAAITLGIASRACPLRLTPLRTSGSFRSSPFRSTRSCNAAEAAGTHDGDSVDVADLPVLDAEVVRVGSSSHKVAKRLDGADGLVDDQASNGGREASRAEAFDGAFARGRRAAAGARFGSATAALVVRWSAQDAWDCGWEPAFYGIELEGRTVMSYIEGTLTFLAYAAWGKLWHFFGTSPGTFSAANNAKVILRNLLKRFSGVTLGLWNHTPAALGFLFQNDIQRPLAIVEPGIRVGQVAVDDCLHLVCFPGVDKDLRADMIPRFIVWCDDFDVDGTARTVQESAVVRELDSL